MDVAPGFWRIALCNAGVVEYWLFLSIRVEKGVTAFDPLNHP